MNRCTAPIKGHINNSKAQTTCPKCGTGPSTNQTAITRNTLQNAPTITHAHNHTQAGNQLAYPWLDKSTAPTVTAVFGTNPTPLDKRPKIAEAFQTLELSVRYLDNIENVPMWDGNTFNFQEGLEIEWQELHELFHWTLAANTSLEKHPEYGLGAIWGGGENIRNNLPERKEGYQQRWGNEPEMKPDEAEKWEVLALDLFPIAHILGWVDETWITKNVKEFGPGLRNRPPEESIHLAWDQLTKLTNMTEQEMVEAVKDYWAEHANIPAWYTNNPPLNIDKYL